MNVIDVFLLIPIGYFAWKGYKKGFIIELFTFLALFVGLYAGIHFSELIAKKLVSIFEWEVDTASSLSFLITFLAVGAMVYFAGKTIEQLVKISMLSPLNKIGGILFSLFKIVYILSFSILLFNQFDKENKVIPIEKKEQSFLYFPIEKFSTVTLPFIKETGLYNKDSLIDSINL
jgi:membrane protein required for colicin V production